MKLHLLVVVDLIFIHVNVIQSIPRISFQIVNYSSNLITHKFTDYLSLPINHARRTYLQRSLKYSPRIL